MKNGRFAPLSRGALALVFAAQHDRESAPRGLGVRGVFAAVVVGVNDPDDPGGATKFGVTIHTMRRLGLDLDGDGDIDSADVRILDREQAVEIFMRHYFEKPRIPMLPEILHAVVFDMQVNAGAAAVKILQKLLDQFGEHLKPDGAIGRRTARAAHRVADSPRGDYLADAYAIARRNYYFLLADRRPASRKYARTRAGKKGGWIRRACASVCCRLPKIWPTTFQAARARPMTKIS